MSVQHLENSISAAIGDDRLSWNERVAVRKELGELVAKAALFEEMREQLNEFMRLNAAHGYEFDGNEKDWYSKTHRLLVRANKIAEAKP